MITRLVEQQNYIVEGRDCILRYKLQETKDGRYAVKCEFILKQPYNDYTFFISRIFKISNKIYWENTNISSDLITDMDKDLKIKEIFENTKEVFKQTCKNRVEELLKGGKIL